jgi:hypothetical protein
MLGKATQEEGEGDTQAPGLRRLSTTSKVEPLGTQEARHGVVCSCSG